MLSLPAVYTILDFGAIDFGLENPTIAILFNEPQRRKEREVKK